MSHWLRGKPGGLLAFVLIATLVAGGLGWTTLAALRLEREQGDERAAAVREVQVRFALGQLDNLVAPWLAREDGRAFNHYGTLFPPPLALTNTGVVCQPGMLLVPSPLLNADLPPWMLLHFQADADGWESPQVPVPAIVQRLQGAKSLTALPNVTPARARLLQEVSTSLPFADLLAAVRERAAPTMVHDTTLQLARRNADLNNYLATLAPQAMQRGGQANGVFNNSAPPQNFELTPQQATDVVNNDGRGSRRIAGPEAYNTVKSNGKDWVEQSSKKEIARSEVTVTMSPMAATWLSGHDKQPRLALVRLVEFENETKCQGVLLDPDQLTQMLTAEVADSLSEMRLVPATEAESSFDDHRMAALPFRLELPAQSDAEDPGWTALRVGLASAWLAALVALAAVGLGGWSLLDLSERRIGFVSAVTHELRTPLTTLRLYLDMLVGGMVSDPVHREEYLQTLHAEADRLHRLIGNVLDFSRLERRSAQLTRTRVDVADLLATVVQAWQRRCVESDKELILECPPLGTDVWTDAGLVEQVLGNLIDNACKYSRGAADARLWLRCRADVNRIIFEVEDRGPGVPLREQRAIFRAFRRGRRVEATAGGVGLGLALARRWTRLLGGSLALRALPCGACFRLELPVHPPSI